MIQTALLFFTAVTKEMDALFPSVIMFINTLAEDRGVKPFALQFITLGHSSEKQK